MSDMLVKLYELPDAGPAVEKVQSKGIVVRNARAYDKDLVVDWVRHNFGDAWASECEVSFTNHPVSCYIAVQDGGIAGFACYDSTCKNFFGPLGVVEELRGRGIGRALLLLCLHAMAAAGYAYGIIGGTGNFEFYGKVAGATEIAGSTPGIYRDGLKG